MKLHPILQSPDNDGSPSAPAGHPSGPSSGEPSVKVGASPQDVFGDAPAPRTQVQPTEPTPARSGITTPVQPTAPAQPRQPTQPTQPVEPEQPTEPVAPTGTTMTDEQLTRLAQTLTAGMQRTAPVAPTQPEAPRQMTPEEQADFDRRFEVVRVSPDMFKGIMGFAPETPDQVKNLENFAHSIMRMSARTTLFEVQRQIKEREDAVRAEFSPIRENFQQQQNARLETDLFEANPDLADFKPLILEITLAEKARGTKFKSNQEVINFVANKARTLLGKSAPASSTQVSGQPVTKKPAMPTTSMGGRSASQSSPQKAASGPKAVFGDLDNPS